MAPRLLFALASTIFMAGAASESVAASAQEIEPRPGVILGGNIQFPRPQSMTIETNRRDASRLTVTMGFDGTCKGGGLVEAWASRVPTPQTVRVKDGRYSASLSGTMRNLGGVEGRSGDFRWRIVGHFVDRDVATATVSGTADIRLDGRLITRCKIADPAIVRLAVRGT